MKLRDCIGVRFEPLEGEFDVERIERWLAGCWGWTFANGWHFLCAGWGDARWVKTSDFSDGLGTSGVPMVEVSATSLRVVPRSPQPGQEALLDAFVRGVTELWPCTVRDMDFGAELPPSAWLLDEPDEELAETWRHGVDVRGEAPDKGLLALLGSEDEYVIWAAVAQVIENRNPLLPWLLRGTALGADSPVLGPHLTALTHRDEIACRLIIAADPPGTRGATIDLMDMDLRATPRGLWRLPNLRFLDLSRNALSHLSGIRSGCVVETLNLADNQFTSLPRGVAHLQALKTLDVGFNPLSEAWPQAKEILVALPELAELTISQTGWDADEVAAALPDVAITA
jgi:hypothetical protein